MAQDSYTWVKKYIYKLVSFVVYLNMSNINICKNKIEFTQICWTMNIYSICKLCMLCIYIYKWGLNTHSFKPVVFSHETARANWPGYSWVLFKSFDPTLTAAGDDKLHKKQKRLDQFTRKQELRKERISSCCSCQCIALLFAYRGTSQSSCTASWLCQYLHICESGRRSGVTTWFFVKVKVMKVSFETSRVIKATPPWDGHVMISKLLDQRVCARQSHL